VPRSAGNSEYEWVIDPLDGTTNFLQGLPVWAVSIACRRGTEMLAGVVLDPAGRQRASRPCAAAGRSGTGGSIRVSDRPALSGAFLATGYPFRAKAALELYLDLFRGIFTEARAIRRCGAAALDLAYVAAGVYDGFFEFRLAPWDIAAGALLIEQAGGVLSDLDGGDRYLDLRQRARRQSRRPRRPAGGREEPRLGGGARSTRAVKRTRLCRDPPSPAQCARPNPDPTLRPAGPALSASRSSSPT
jgi:fructose-1,6-bisphosphatase/inositol monophosphatase family enzyme